MALEAQRGASDIQHEEPYQPPLKEAVRALGLFGPSHIQRHSTYFRQAPARTARVVGETECTSEEAHARITHSTLTKFKHHQVGTERSTRAAAPSSPIRVFCKQTTSRPQ